VLHSDRGAGSSRSCRRLMFTAAASSMISGCLLARPQSRRRVTVWLLGGNIPSGFLSGAAPERATESKPGTTLHAITNETPHASLKCLRGNDRDASLTLRVHVHSREEHEFWVSTYPFGISTVSHGLAAGRKYSIGFLSGAAPERVTERRPRISFRVSAPACRSAASTASLVFGAGLEYSIGVPFRCCTGKSNGKQSQHNVARNHR
jgi:hypothetical protein